MLKDGMSSRTLKNNYYLTERGLGRNMGGAKCGIGKQIKLK